MKKLAYALFLLLGVFCAFKGKAQQYIYISEDGIYKVLRVNVGLTQWRLTPVDSPFASANGIYLNSEVKLISNVVNRTLGFTIHDAFYLDMSVGVMSQDKRVAHNGELESKISFNINTGYLALAGYRTEKWAALGGMDFRFSTYQVGGKKMPNIDGPLFYASRPLVLRGEYALSKSNPNVRAILSIWATRPYSSFVKNELTRAPYQSVRLELPLNKNGRFWFFTQYCHSKQMGEDVHMFYPPRVFTFNQFMLGLRVGNLP